MSRGVAEGSGLLTHASTGSRAAVVRRRAHGPRHARSTEPAAGLERRAPNEPERLPSDRPGSRDPSWLVAFVVHTHAPRLAPCRLPQPWSPRQRTTGRCTLSPLRPRTPRRELPRCAANLGRRRERCASPTSATELRFRAPRRLSDSQVRPPPPLDPREPRAGHRAPAHHRSSIDDEPPSEASVDAEPSASALSHPPWPTCPGRPVHADSRSAARSWRSVDRTLLSRSASRPRRCQPCAERATQPLTPSVATALARGGLSANLVCTAARCRARVRPVKDDRFFATRTPSLDECHLPMQSDSRSRDRHPGSHPPPPPTHAFARARLGSHRIIDSPPPYPRLCRRAPASSTASPPGACRGTIRKARPSAHRGGHPTR